MSFTYHRSLFLTFTFLGLLILAKFLTLTFLGTFLVLGFGLQVGNFSKIENESDINN
jgi:hypothetical protein